VTQDLFHDGRVVDDGDDAHRFAALWASKRVGVPDFADDKIMRRITGRARFFKRAFELMAAK
jgi:hypothetical protein